MSVEQNKLAYVTELCGQLHDASIRAAMGGLGGCKTFNLSDFSPEYHNLIMRYVTDDITSIEAMLLAAEDFDRRETT